MIAWLIAFTQALILVAIVYIVIAALAYCLKLIQKAERRR